MPNTVYSRIRGFYTFDSRGRLVLPNIALVIFPYF